MAKLGHRILEEWISVGKTHRTVENRSSCVLGLCACGKQQRLSESWATKLLDVWDTSTFMDKFEITGRPVQFPLAHICRPHSAPKSREKFTHSWDPRTVGVSEAESYTCACSTTFNIRNETMSKRVSKRKKKLPKKAKQFQFGHCVSVDVNKKECGAVRARTNQPENGIASPGK